MRKVLVTGASSDIGLEICRIYQREGWSVIGHCRKKRAEFKALDQNSFEPWVCDFSNPDTLEKQINDKKSEFSDVAAFINLAASLQTSKFKSYSCTRQNSF